LLNVPSKLTLFETASLNDADQRFTIKTSDHASDDFALALNRADNADLARSSTALTTPVPPLRSQ